MKIEQRIPQRREGELLIRLKQEPQQGFVDSFAGQVLERFDLPAVDKAPQGPILHIALPKGQTVDQAIEQFKDDPHVAYACSNDILTSFDAPSTALPDAKLWGMPAIHAPEAWQINHGDRVNGPLLAVVDCGIDYNHPNLAPNVYTNPGEIAGNGIDDDHNGVIDDVHGYNAAAKNGEPMDTTSHGTHVMGTIAGIGVNGVTGVSPEARVLAVKFIQDGYGDTADAIAGLLYADNMGARITSNSWGGSNYNQALYDTLKASPALHICAAGNDHADNDVTPAYPASYDLPNIVSVAAVGQDGNLAHFSNFGATSVDLAAPGENIYSTLPNGEYGMKSGTSMAAPHVSGSANLIATRFPNATNQEIKDRLVFSSTRQPQFEGKMISGGGFLNVASALEDDRIAPAPVGDLQAPKTTSEQAQLRWLAPGDDGMNGNASAYEVRYSSRPIKDEKSFQEAPSVPTPIPQAPGSVETLQIPLVPAGQDRNFHFAVRAVDNVGNRGPIVSTQATIPAAQVAFSDDGENGTGQWTATGTWGLQDVPGHGKVWTDSPYSDYGYKENSTLTSKPFSLVGFKNPQLRFDARYDLEITFDNVALEASTDGKEWKKLDNFNLLKGWEKHEYDLTPYAGGPLQLRFHLTTDDDVNLDGFYFDNLVVSEKAQPQA